MYTEVANDYGKNESSLQEITKKEKEIGARFVVEPQTKEVLAMLCNKCFIKVEKSLNLCVEGIENVF